MNPAIPSTPQPARLRHALGLLAVAAAATLAGCDRNDTSTSAATPPSAASPAASSAPAATPAAASPAAGMPAAASADAAAAAGGAAVPASDRAFMEKAAGGGIHEVEAGKLGRDKGASAGVKEYGAMLVDHHTKANDELKAIAAAKGVTLPADEPADKKADTQKLAGLSGADFDQQFVAMVGLKDHEETIKLFEDGAASSSDPQLKAFIDKTLPTLKMHLDQARKLQR